MTSIQIVILTDSYSSRGQGTAVTKHSILVHSNVAKVTELLNLIACRRAFTTSELKLHLSKHVKY